ncbi:hypothetical protein [uncultured Photobacterium sp.]|uniref:hypothetical protein n=1 Tax=uncultured Photobacterium sp. TaxID=173973 RepID=UPI00262CFF72|nr:hypothetical protein [uncultured Photobacterium sp.]
MTDFNNMAERLAMPAPTLRQWQKSRPDYFRHPEMALAVLSPDRLATFKASENSVKEMATELGLPSPLTDETFPVPSRTLRDWIAGGKIHRLILAMVVGHQQCHLDEMPGDIRDWFEATCSEKGIQPSALLSLYLHNPQVMEKLI